MALSSSILRKGKFKFILVYQKFCTLQITTSIIEGVQGEGHLFTAMVLASAPPSTNFKSIYSNQFKRYEYIQGIWEMQNFMNNTMVKNFLARAHFRARAGRIFCLLGQNLMIFEFSQRYEVWRAPRAQVRARPKFFNQCKLC